MLYETNTGTFTAKGSMQIPRFNFTATLIPDGRVLVAGGEISGGFASSAEIYDPATGNPDGTPTPDTAA